MNNQPYVTNPAAGSRAKEAVSIEGRRQFENRVESRWKDVASVVSSLAGSLFSGLREYADPTDKVLETLLAKEARLRWLVRVAKYSEGTNREALWREVEKQLLYLEEDVDELLLGERV